MSFFSRHACAAVLTASSAIPVFAQEGSLTVSVGFGPTPSGPKHVPASSRNLAQNWSIEMGLDNV